MKPSPPFSVRLADDQLPLSRPFVRSAAASLLIATAAVVVLTGCGGDPLTAPENPDDNSPPELTVPSPGPTYSQTPRSPTPDVVDLDFVEAIGFDPDGIQELSLQLTEARVECDVRGDDGFRAPAPATWPTYPGSQRLERQVSDTIQSSSGPQLPVRLRLVFTTSQRWLADAKRWVDGPCCTDATATTRQSVSWSTSLVLRASATSWGGTTQRGDIILARRHGSCRSST